MINHTFGSFAFALIAYSTRSIRVQNVQGQCHVWQVLQGDMLGRLFCRRRGALCVYFGCTIRPVEARVGYRKSARVGKHTGSSKVRQEYGQFKFAR